MEFSVEIFTKNFSPSSINFPVLGRVKKTYVKLEKNINLGLIAFPIIYRSLFTFWVQSIILFQSSICNVRYNTANHLWELICLDTTLPISPTPTLQYYRQLRHPFPLGSCLQLKEVKFNMEINWCCINTFQGDNWNNNWNNFTDYSHISNSTQYSVIDFDTLFWFWPHDGVLDFERSQNQILSVVCYWDKIQP